MCIIDFAVGMFDEGHSVTILPDKSRSDIEANNGHKEDNDDISWGDFHCALRNRQPK